MTELTELLIERDGPTGVLTLNRPDALNSISPTMTTGIDDALRELASDRSCRAIVVTGAGRAFCAGIDVKSVAARDASSRESADTDRLDPVVAGYESLHIDLSKFIRTIHSLPIPVIAAVNGAAVGAGFAIAAASDLRIGSQHAMFMDGFVTRGISGCELGLSYFLPKIVAPSVAFDWMLTGRRVRSEEALSAGIISQLVDADELLTTALELADSIANNAPMAITMTKEVMWANLHAASLDQALALESRTQNLTRTTADAAEARASFIEKRSPEFNTAGGARPLR